MAKQKNDVISAQQRRNKRLKITAVLLIVAVIGLWNVFLSAPRTTVDSQALLKEISLPENALPYEPFCIGMGGRDNQGFWLHFFY